MNPYPCPQAEECPGCARIDGAELTRCTSRVSAWKCIQCNTQWAISVVNPHLRPDYPATLAAAVEQLSTARSLLTQIITLAQDAPMITDVELRSRLVALDKCAL